MQASFVALFFDSDGASLHIMHPRHMQRRTQGTTTILAIEILAHLIIITKIIHLKISTRHFQLESSAKQARNIPCASIWSVERQECVISMSRRPWTAPKGGFP